ncbi:MAG: IS4 family transposase [Hyphomicrobiales bacterium]|nr:MAG: IS4 family transposase [Hyphomicrobiales bacterium]
MVTLATVLADITEDVRRVFPAEAIVRVCQRIGHIFRLRLLDPVTTIHAFAIQVLHGNTACSHLRHLLGATFTGAAYCQARRRLPLRLFRVLLRWACRSARRGAATFGRWHGHRVIHVDGSRFSMADTPALQAAFGQPGGQRAGCGFPVAHLLAMFDAATGLLLDVLAAPLRTHDLSQVSHLHRRLQADDVVVADRGFCSYVHLALLCLRGIHAVFRLHQKMLVDFTPGRPHARPGDKRGPSGLPRSRWVRLLGVQDQVVEWFKPVAAPRWMSATAYASLPASLFVRELRYRVTAPGYRTRHITLVTTLLDDEVCPADELAQLYRCRWQVETNLRYLKVALGMDVLRCKSVEGVRKELLMFALIYNLVRCVMLAAGKQQGVPPDRISFIDATRWLQAARDGRPLPRLKVNPLRLGRLEPRVRKRRPKQYSLMKHPRQVLRNALEIQSVNA